MTANLLQPVMAGDAVLPSSMCSHTQAWIRKKLFTVAAGASVCMFEHTILRVTRSEAIDRRLVGLRRRLVGLPHAARNIDRSSEGPLPTDAL